MTAAKLQQNYRKAILFSSLLPIGAAQRLMVLNLMPLLRKRSCAVLLLASCCVHLEAYRLLPNALPQAPQAEKINERPLIGILTQPGDPAPRGYSYIAASYVKFVEAAGARVVPIEYDLPAGEVENRFEAINGLLIPGGAAELAKHHPFYDTAHQLLKLALEANDRNDYFPVHGTCLGFEALGIIVSKNASLLSKFNSEDNASPLFLTEEAPDSHFIRSLPPQVLKDLQTHAYAMENHGSGISYRSYDESPELRAFFKVLSLSADRDGSIYISTMEAREYPVTATQWHPEKNTYEWTPDLHIPHSEGAIAVTHAVANFVVSEARRNLHSPASLDEEEGLLIYNNQLAFTGKHTYKGEETAFDECYFFPELRRRGQEEE